MKRWIFRSMGLAGGLAIAIALWYADGHKETQPPHVADPQEAVPASIEPASRLPFDAARNPRSAPLESAPVPGTPMGYSAEDEAMIAGIAKRQAAYDELLARSPMEIWRQWQTLLEQNQVSELSFASHALAQRMQQSGGEQVYEEMNSLLQEKDLPADRKALLVGLLTETATPAALEILLAAARNEIDIELRRRMLDGIREVGDRRWDGRFHSELSPALEAAWAQADTGDTDLLSALAVTLAKVGAPNGVEYLLAAVTQGGKTMREIQQGQDARAHAALNALREIRNPEAIPTLEKWIHSASPMDSDFVASGDALAAMGLPKATNVLLEWAKQAADEEASLAGKWLGKVRDTESVRILREAVSQEEAFRSQQVRQKLVESFRLLGSAAG